MSTLSREETARGVTQEIANAHAARFRKTELLGDRGYTNLVVKAVLAEVDIAVYIGGIQADLLSQRVIEEIVYRAMVNQGFNGKFVYEQLIGSWQMS